MVAAPAPEGRLPEGRTPEGRLPVGRDLEQDFAAFLGQYGVASDANPDFEIESAVFALDGEGPLSWQLSDAQRRQVEESWEDEGNRGARARVGRFFND